MGTPIMETAGPGRAWVPPTDVEQALAAAKSRADRDGCPRVLLGADTLACAPKDKVDRKTAPSETPAWDPQPAAIRVAPRITGMRFLPGVNARGSSQDLADLELWQQAAVDWLRERGAGGAEIAYVLDIRSTSPAWVWPPGSRNSPTPESRRPSWASCAGGSTPPGRTSRRAARHCVSDQLVAVNAARAVVRISSESGEPLVARARTSAPSMVHSRVMPSWSSVLSHSAKSLTPSV